MAATHMPARRAAVTFTPSPLYVYFFLLKQRLHFYRVMLNFWMNYAVAASPTSLVHPWVRCSYVILCPLA